MGEHDQLLEVFETEVEVEYRGERYRVRDNGAVYRLDEFRNEPAARQDMDLRTPESNDRLSSFGRRSDPSHRLRCFNGPPPTDQHVVDHIDTNRANNRPENLRWLTRLENAR
ncbi:MAG: HNH endonuclease signature motif containing protein [Rhizobiaceae bacterium]